MMHMQLGYHIANSGNIQFVRAKQCGHCLGHDAGLMEQLLTIFNIKLIDFLNAVTLGHQDNPGVIGILAQQHQTQGKFSHQHSVSQQSLM